MKHVIGKEVTEKDAREKQASNQPTKEPGKQERKHLSLFLAVTIIQDSRWVCVYGFVCVCVGGWVGLVDGWVGGLVGGWVGGYVCVCGWVCVGHMDIDMCLPHTDGVRREGAPHSSLQ